ncbi:hexulose-6-phosphate synthase, partial [bacteria symbiont BFo2 of Frankliniella occidentalis]
MNVATNYDDDLRTFSKAFDTTSEDKALSARGHFLLSYPLKELKNITIDEYVIGKGTPSFCASVEAKTKAWANIQGATANKFGIYYGKIKSDPTSRYRYTKKFGKTKKEAFNRVKDALLNLIQAGKSKKYRDIDENPLSQMFKAKILSLYFPSIYLNICSSEHLEKIAIEMGIEGQRYSREYQHLLIEKKMNN